MQIDPKIIKTAAEKNLISHQALGIPALLCTSSSSLSIKNPFATSISETSQSSYLEHRKKLQIVAKLE